MPESNFIEVKLANRKNTIKIEKGCSFENNGAIYHVDNKGALNIFDKNNKTWSVGKEINIHDYQLQTLMAVANNHDEIENGKVLNGIVLSSTDIDKAIKQHKEGGLSLDLARYLGGDYEIKSANRYTNDNGISTYVSNGNKNTSANLIFKFGTKESAVKLSELVNKAKEVIKKVIPQTKKNSQPAATPETKAKAEVKVETSSKKVAKTTPQITENKKTTKINASSNAQIVAKKAKVTKSPTVENTKTVEKTPSTKTSKKRTVDSMPEFYQVSLKTVAKKLNMSVYALQKEIKKAALKTGYSEYLIAHLICVEDYEKAPRNIGDGAITVGFGHTNLRDENITKKTKVTPQKAFAWLANDIKYFENYVKKLKVNTLKGKTYGDYFDKLPLSMREGLIDVAFNRDAKKLETASEYSSLRINLEKGYYPAAAVRIRQNFKSNFEQAKKKKFMIGLMKRNVYRFLLAVRDFEPKDIEAAKRRFEADGYYSQTVDLLKFRKQKSEIKLMDNAWQKIN